MWVWVSIWSVSECRSWCLVGRACVAKSLKCQTITPSFPRGLDETAGDLLRAMLFIKLLFASTHAFDEAFRGVLSLSRCSFFIDLGSTWKPRMQIPIHLVQDTHIWQGFQRDFKPIPRYTFIVPSFLCAVNEKTVHAKPDSSRLRLSERVLSTSRGTLIDPSSSVILPVWREWENRACKTRFTSLTAFGNGRG